MRWARSGWPDGLVDAHVHLTFATHGENPAERGSAAIESLIRVPSASPASRVCATAARSRAPRRRRPGRSCRWSCRAVPRVADRRSGKHGLRDANAGLHAPARRRAPPPADRGGSAVFAEHAFEEISMREIAASAGVSRRSSTTTSRARPISSRPPSRTRRSSCERCSSRPTARAGPRRSRASSARTCTGSRATSACGRS